MNSRTNRLAARARILYLGIPLAVVALTLLVGNFMLGVVANNATRRLAHLYSIEAASDFINSTIAHFGVAQQLSRSPGVIRWLANENDEEAKARAVEEFIHYSAFAPHVRILFTVEESKNIYVLPWGFTAADFVPRGQTTRLPCRIWYEEALYGVLPFSLNVEGGIDAEGTIYNWVNWRAYYQGSFVGLVSAGVPFASIFDAVFGDYDVNTRRGYIIDGNGLVRVDSAGLLQVITDGQSTPVAIPEAYGNPSFADGINLHLQTLIDGAYLTGSETDGIFSLQGDFQYAGIAPIVGTNWSTVVLLSRVAVHSVEYTSLLFGFFTIVALIVVVGGVLVRRWVFVPLFKLTRSTARVGTAGGAELFGLERKDEIGDLARMITQSRSNLKHREELLSAVNQAAGVLLTAASEEDSMAAIAKAMEIIGLSVNADRVLFWKNETVDGEICFVVRNRWIRNADKKDEELQIGSSFPYRNNPGWFEMFAQGRIINSPVSELEPAHASFLSNYSVKSVVIIPLFADGKFFGRLSVGDCHRERTFSEMEVDIIRSAGMMFVNAYNIIEQANEIKASAAKTEEANKAKSQFLARMSHEIRTPMNAVLGITQVQLQKAELPSETEDAFLRIYHSSNLLLSIINEILDLSKVEAGRMEIIPQPYETVGMIVETVQLNMVHIGSKPIDFKLSIDENIPCFMYGDELRIKQIMNNILSNAFKYTAKGSVTLSMRREKSTQDNTLNLVIEVADTGQGLSKTQLNSLFEIEFNRFNLHLNRDIEGSGLGMSITYHLVGLMDGKIFVESKQGKGSVFTVRIPQQIHGEEILGETASELQNFEAVKNMLKKIVKKERAEIANGRVLVVDDIELNLFVAEGMLIPYKLSVETATSGAEAVEKIRSGKIYDIIFMDHMMPDMDGIEVTKLIRDEGYELPIIALTANVLADHKEMFLDNGFDGFIPKPIDAERLDKCLKMFIREK